MAERRPPYAPAYRRPHWSVVGLAPYRGVAKHGDITAGRGDACVAPTASFRAGLELSFCGADSSDPAEGRETPWIDPAPPTGGRPRRRRPRRRPALPAARRSSGTCPSRGRAGRKAGSAVDCKNHQRIRSLANIFDRIFQYRQSAGRTPREDYFTELFASVLEKCEYLGATIVGKLISCNNITRVKLQTQKHFSSLGRRVDLYVTAWDRNGQKHVLVVESKLDSVEGENQLPDYIELLAQDEKAHSRTLAYITKKSEKLNVPTLERQGRRNNVTFKHLKWSQVYGWIEEFVDELEGPNLTWKELLKELLALMEDWDMGGPISARSMRAALDYHNSLDSGKCLFEPINSAWSESGINDVLDWRGHWYYRDYYKYCWQSSPYLANFGNAQISMGFQFDRRDDVWDVDKMELPSAAVTISEGDEGGIPFPQPSEEWEEGPVPGMYDGDQWVRQTSQPPRHGESLEEFYRAFFLQAFTEIRNILQPPAG